MFKVGDRVVANGFLRVGEEDQLNRKATKWVNDKTVLTVFDITEGANFSGDILCGTSNVAGFRFRYDKSELRYATEGEIAEADKVVRVLIKNHVPGDKKEGLIPTTAELFEAFSNRYREYFRDLNSCGIYGMGLSHLIGDGQPFFSMSHPKDKDRPEDFNITTTYDTDCEIDISNDCEHIEIDTGDEGSGVVYLEPQEARATAKALCEHAEYVERMKEKTKPKQSVFKVWKEGVKDEDGVVWLRLVRDPSMERNGITLRRVCCNGECMLGGNILIIKDDGTLRRWTDCIIPGIQTAYGRIKEAE